MSRVIKVERKIGKETNGTPLGPEELEGGSTDSVVIRDATDPELAAASPDRRCGMNTATDAPC